MLFYFGFLFFIFSILFLLFVICYLFYFYFCLFVTFFVYFIFYYKFYTTNNFIQQIIFLYNKIFFKQLNNYVLIYFFTSWIQLEKEQKNWFGWTSFVSSCTPPPSLPAGPPRRWAVGGRRVVVVGGDRFVSCTSRSGGSICIYFGSWLLDIDWKMYH